MPHTVEIIIPSWNGRKILSQCLPGMLDCAREITPAARVTIVDDASTDGTPEYLRQNSPSVHVVRLTARRGFPGAVNAGILPSTADLILLVNNDMIPRGPVLAPLLEHFGDAGVAAVSARVLTWDGARLDVGRRLRTFDRGEIAGVGDNEDYADVSYTFFASGGAMALDRRKFAELGGFDEIYSPGYVEDTDFSYRAWKRGWKIAWDPRATFLHMGSATFAPKSGGLRKLVNLCRVRYLAERNSFYFYWKNLTDEKARHDYWKHLPGRAHRALCRGDAIYLVALIRTIAMHRELSRLQKQEAALSVLSDFDVFRRLGELCRTSPVHESDPEGAYAQTG